MFPAGFQWGAATAGFQVDMGCPTWSDDVCVDDASDWYDWVTDPSIVGNPSLHVSGEPLSAGPGMWETFEADADRMQADGFNAYRMSIEWSRLFPDGAAESATTVDALTEHADVAAVARYHEMFSALRERGIEPIVTLNHYVLPRWVHDGVACHADPDSCTADGWVTKDRILPLISLYSAWVAREYGGEVDHWYTLNEPYATSLSGYLQPGEDRSSPPGLDFDVDRTIAVMLNQIDGHAVMYDAVKAEDALDADGDGDPARVGIVMNFTAIDPFDPESADDVRAAEHMDYLYHRLYLDAFTTGAWDGDLDGVAETTRPELADRLDVLGINYYNQVKVRGFAFSVVPEIPIFDLFPEFSWEPYPEGLGRVVRRGAEWGVPIVVTENGTPFVEDRGVEVLDGHLEALASAMADGVDVDGYLYWSLVDNYEWNHGFDLRFGLYELDPETKERTARPVLERLRTIVERNSLD
jgi:beta-glucosidase/6-phospho-beta-glucosidase/beta-galactosidase